MSRVIESLSTDPGILLAAILGSLAILSVAAVLITALGARAWRRVHEIEANNAVKHALLAQGMSADDIAAVVTAWPCRNSRTSSGARFCDREVARF